MRRLVVLLLTSLASAAVCARQDEAPVRAAVEQFLKSETRGMPGRVSTSVGAIDPDNNLTPCPALRVSLPRGGRLWGKVSVSVHCQGNPGWTLFVPVQVSVFGDYLVTARSLARGQVIGEADVALQSGDLTEMPDGVLTDAKQAVGSTLAVSLVGGRPLRSDALRQPLAVQQGQGVKVVSRGVGFQVSSEGRALNNAAAGQVVQVRLRNGQVVSGIARSEGTVEISY